MERLGGGLDGVRIGRNPLALQKLTGSIGLRGTDLPPDPLTETSPVLAALVSASVQSRVALGSRAGARVSLSFAKTPAGGPWLIRR